jgi:nitroimidazol reductase NimA-like FMN-containing flavoprotein (pyridoxamine 5'-phosphate oxidase superfamily)
MQEESSMQRTTRTTVQRHPERGVYDAETIHAILDAGFLCHVGFVRDEQPFVIPTLYARVGEKLYLHGSPLSRVLQPVEGGVPLCVTVTHVDALVLARSAFHHSINYRSVMVLGRGHVVTERAEKEMALSALVDQVVPGRSAEVRGPSRQELKGTQVMVIPLEEASAKVRTGPPLDAAKDYKLDIWAGVLPLRLEPQELIPDPRLSAEIPVPEHVQRYRPRSNESQV